MAEVLTADQLNAIAKQSGYTGGPFSSAGLPTTNTASTPIAGYVPPPTTTPISSPAPAPAISSPSPEDQKLLAIGITKEQLAQLNGPNGMDPASFSGLISNVEQKLKTNNELVTQRGYLIKHLYDSPLTPEELAKLPEDIQRVVTRGDKDTTELQLRLLNDQIAGRGNTLTQGINYLVHGYETAVKQLEDERNNAVNTVVDFVGAYGSKASEVLASLYGPEYLAKLKAMGIDINKMASISTLAQDKANKNSPDGTDTFTQSQLNKGASNAGLGLEEFKNLPYEVKNFFVNSSAANIADIQDAIAEIRSGGVDVEEAKSQVDALAIPQAVKDYLKGLMDAASSGKVETASAPGMFANPFRGDSNIVKNYFTNTWEGLKSLF